MRFRTWQDVDAAGYVDGPLYRIDTIVFDECADLKAMDADFWYDERIGLWAHPFDCFFTDLDEARLWCRAFTPKMLEWTHRMGNGPKFGSVAVDVIEMYRCYGEWAPGYAVSTYDWRCDGTYEEWHDQDVIERGLEMKV